MKSKSNWLIILIGMIIAFAYICISCIFYMKFSEALVEISKYQVDIMKSSLSIQKLIIISCLFIVFITIFFVSVLLNMEFKIQDYRMKIDTLHSEIINAEVQNHRKEIQSEDEEEEEDNLKKELLKYKELDKCLIKINSSVRNEVTEIQKLLLNIKIEEQLKNVGMLIKSSEEGIKTTEEIYNKLTSFYNNESKLKELSSKINNLKYMANETAINAAIENTKIKSNGSDSSELLVVSDVSRKLIEHSNSISKDIEEFDKEVNDKSDKLSDVVDKIKNIYVTQGNISKETKGQFDVLNRGIDEALKRINLIVNRFQKLEHFDDKK